MESTTTPSTRFRIGLITRDADGKSNTTFVDAADLAELRKSLAGLGAKRAALYYRDRVGNGHIEGATFPVEQLDPARFEWVAEPPPATIRQLYYEL